MKHTIAINGFGRIGRNVLRAMTDNPDHNLTVVAINDLAPIETLTHLLRHDSVHGRFNADVTVEDDNIIVNGHPIRVTAQRDPEKLPWADIDIAYECTGRFRSRDQAALHLKNGSKRVLISAPGKDADRTIVYGVNHGQLTSDDIIVSNASCTTNCLAPIVQVLDDTFGIKTGYMTTVHSYTGDQPTHDRDHRDLYRARAAAMSMIPTTTGAAKATTLVLPHLKGRLEGSAIRVPTPNVSLIDLVFVPIKPATVEAVNAAMQTAAKGRLKGVLAYVPEPLVSVDFNHDPHSSSFAPAQTSVTNDGLVRVVSWYDNEWGFSNRMIDTGGVIASLL